LVGELRRQVDRLERLVRWQAGWAQAERPSAPPLVRFLTQRGFEDDFAAAVAAEVDELLTEWVRTGRHQPGGGAGRADSRALPRRPGPNPAGPGVFRFPPGTVAADVARRGLVAEAMLSVLAGRVACAPEPPAGRGRVCVLVGPPGAGKTVTLAKLAALAALGGEGRSRGDVAVLSADTVRIAAAEQLRTYAAILGVPFEIAATPAAFDLARRQHAARDLLLVDMPGWGPAERQSGSADEWRTALARPGVEVHLVLPATMAPAECRRTLNAFRPYGVTRLVVSHAGETLSGGGLFTVLAGGGVPVSYLTHGQSIPEDIEQAGPDRLLDLAFAADLEVPGAPRYAAVEQDTEPAARRAPAEGNREFAYA